MEDVRPAHGRDNDNDAVLIRRESDASLRRPMSTTSEHSCVRPRWMFCTACHSLRSQHPRIQRLGALSNSRACATGCPVHSRDGMLVEETAVRYLRGGAAGLILKDRLVRLGPHCSKHWSAPPSGRVAWARTPVAPDIDSNPSLIFVKDWNGRFVLVNQATAQVYGTPWIRSSARPPPTSILREDSRALPAG